MRIFLMATDEIGRLKDSLVYSTMHGKGFNICMECILLKLGATLGTRAQIARIATYSKWWLKHSFFPCTRIVSMIIILLAVDFLYIPGAANM